MRRQLLPAMHMTLHQSTLTVQGEVMHVAAVQQSTAFDTTADQHLPPKGEVLPETACAVQHYIANMPYKQL